MPQRRFAREYFLPWFGIHGTWSSSKRDGSLRCSRADSLHSRDVAGNLRGSLLHFLVENSAQHCWFGERNEASAALRKEISSSPPVHSEASSHRPTWAASSLPLTWDEMGPRNTSPVDKHWFRRQGTPVWCGVFIDLERHVGHVFTENQTTLFAFWVSI